MFFGRGGGEGGINRGLSGGNGGFICVFIWGYVFLAKGS